MTKDERVKTISFLIIFLATTAAFLFTISNLWLPIFYGAVLAIVVHPFYSYLRKRLGNRQVLAGIISVLAAILGLLLILGLLGTYLAQDALLLFNTARDKVDALSPNLQVYAESFRNLLPDYLSNQFADVDLRGQVTEALRSVTSAIFSALQSFTGNIVSTLALSLIMVYSFFYLLVNGVSWLKHLSKILPLPDEDEEKLGLRFIQITRAAFKLVFVMGAIQGFLGGLIFALLGIPAPVFWGVAFAIFSLIPGLGHPLIWLPTALILGVLGSPVKAVILVIYGLVVMGLVDDVLRPYLLGRQENIHPFLILIATIGGLTVFGFAGIILGPVVAAMTVTIWRMFEERYGAAGT